MDAFERTITKPSVFVVNFVALKYLVLMTMKMALPYLAAQNVDSLTILLLNLVHLSL